MPPSADDRKRHRLAPGATRWTVRTAARRAADVLRDGGPRELWFRVLGETVYRRLLVTEQQLPGPSLPPSELRLELRFVDRGDLDAYAELRPDAAPEEAADRLAAGDRCFGAWLDGRLVSARWFQTGTAWIEYLDRRVELRAGEAYLYDLHTAADHRGRSISRAAAAGWAEALEREGIRRLVGTVLPENRAVLRATEKAGWRVVGRIGFVKLGRRRRDFGGL